MNRMKRLIPILLLGEDGLYKTSNFQKPKYVGDPINAIHIFSEKEVDEVIILDITEKAKIEGPNFEVLREIAGDLFAPVSYGGGIQTIQQAEKIMRLGFDKLSFCSALYNKKELVIESAKTFGSQAVVGCIETRLNKQTGSYDLFYNNGKSKIFKRLIEHVRYVETLGVGEILVNDISKEGTLSGYDVALHSEIANMTKLPVIASGGGNSYKNISNLLQNTKVSAAACGAFFIYYGPYNAVLITYPDIKTKDEILNG